MTRVVITGPESCGKTTLLESVKHLSEVEITEEFARCYLDGIKRPYQYEDIYSIALGQIAIENDAIESNKKLVIQDTDLLTLKIWCEFKYKKCHSLIKKELCKRLPSLYILCYPDIPWEYDAQRENPNDRLAIFKLYEEEIKKLKVNYIILKGSKENRLNKVEQLISKLVSM